jgi:hypothetical protein
MAIGIEIKEGFTLRACDKCKNAYYADNRNLKRGWGLCCSKKCAAKKREESKPGYSPERVAENNYRREHWNDREDKISDYDDGLDYLLECGDRSER